MQGSAAVVEISPNCRVVEFILIISLQHLLFRVVGGGLGLTPFQLPNLQHWFINTTLSIFGIMVIWKHAITAYIVCFAAICMLPIFPHNCISKLACAETAMICIFLDLQLPIYHFL